MQLLPPTMLILLINYKEYLMSKPNALLKRISYVLLIIIQIGFTPLYSSNLHAQEASTTDPAASETETTEPVSTDTPTEESTPEVTEPTAPNPVAPTAPEPPSNTGPTSPTGDQSTTYTYNEATGLWENQYYTWDPVTKKTTSKSGTDYTYDPATGMWQTTKWVYDAPSGTYKPKEIQLNRTQMISSGLATANELDQQVKNSADINLKNDATISNDQKSCSTSGDASVSENTNAGSAKSGDAYTMANILNMLGSNWGDLGQDVKTFVTDINGDVVGDIYVNPDAISPNSTNNLTKSTENNLDINAQNQGSIYNNVNLCSYSGSANVSSNTKAGDATSGNADAVANILNLINSTVQAGDSFVGVMNINGNLDGDILLPDYLKIDNLLAANTGPSASLNQVEIENGELIANLLTSENIDNNVTTDAKSGDASVQNNNSAGSASTGDAQTNVTLLNLTGRDIIGNNGLLVFVNVLGTWVGFIVDAPTGSSSVALAGGVDSDTTVQKSTQNSANINASEDYGIKNDIKVTSASGEANVSENTEAGNAKSGDATASANILNLVNSRLTLKDWFGVLFINVFGSWHGSFGIDTSRGNVAALQNLAQNGSVPVQNAQVFSFSPTTKNKVKLQNVTSSFEEPVKDPEVLLASAQVPGNYKPIAKTPNEIARQQQMKNKVLNFLSFGSVLTLSFLGIEQVSNLRDKIKKGLKSRKIFGGVE